MPAQAAAAPRATRSPLAAEPLRGVRLRRPRRVVGAARRERAAERASAFRSCSTPATRTRRSSSRTRASSTTTAPGGRLAVYRTRDRGETWERMADGLPAAAWAAVLREGSAYDERSLYFGTQSGSFFALTEGDRWVEARATPAADPVGRGDGMVQVVVPSVLAAQAEGRRRFDVEAETVGDALRALPVADLIFNERGELHPASQRVRRRDGPSRAGRSGGSARGRARDTGRGHGLRRLAPGGSAHAVLLGRSAECARLDRLLADAKAGQSAVLVLRGAAGTGKTALLEYAAERAEGYRVVRAVGVESEMELPFAGLHQLCGGAARRPRAVAGAAARRARDRVRVERRRPARSLPDQPGDAQPAVRGRRGTAAAVPGRRRPVARSVVGAGARLRGPAPAGRVGRPRCSRSASRSSSTSWRGCRTCGSRDCRTRTRASCSRRSSARRWTSACAARILAEARGNPLALLELPRDVVARELAGGFGLPGELPLQSRIEASFRRRVRQLPAATQRLLLLAAAEPTGEPALLWRSAAELGIPIEAVGARRGRRHARARRAGRLPPPAPALGDLPRGVGRRSASRASGAGRGHRCRGRSRSSGLAPRPGRRSDPTRTSPTSWSARPGGRRRAAAWRRPRRSSSAPPRSRSTPPRERGVRSRPREPSSWPARPRRRCRCCRRPRTGRWTSSTRAMLRAAPAARSRSTCRRAGDAVPLLLDAARRLESLDPGLARETYLEALRAASVAGRLGGGMLTAATAARDAPPRPGRATCDRPAARWSRHPVHGRLRRERAGAQACAGRGARGGRSAGQNVRWPWIARRVAPDLFEDDTWHALATRNVQIARDAGALAVLPLALNALATAAVLRGRPRRARRR